MRERELREYLTETGHNPFREWLHSLRRDAEPVELDVTSAELVAEARDEAG